MTFPHQSQMYPGHPYPYREPPPIPKKHTFLIALVLLGTLALVVISLVIGFWRAVDAPVPVIEPPELETPAPPPQTPTPK